VTAEKDLGMDAESFARLSPADALRAHIRDIPDFPAPGIVFRDVTPLFADPVALQAATGSLAGYAESVGAAYVVSAEARGFVLGGAMAAQAGIGFILARKPGKLPRETTSVQYQLEYGVDALEMHSDSLSQGARVLVHDDLLATGGTAEAVCGLVEQAGATVAGCAFLVELAYLGGRARLAPREVHSLIVYESE
jgi:adenine phosphoribosyltransferase